MPKSSTDLLNSKKWYLITGGAGFIGYHLGKALLELGNNVWVIDDYSQSVSESLYELKHIYSDEQFRIWEKDYTQVQLIETINPTEISHFIHLASPVGVPVVMKTSAARFDEHEFASKKWIDWALNHQMTLFFASSSEVYGNQIVNRPLYESDVLPETWFENQAERFRYAKLKRRLEIYIQQKAISGSSNYVIGRFFNVFGPGQRAENGMVIPTFVKQAINDLPITLHGDGTFTRSFIPVWLAVKAIISLLGQHNAKGIIVNIGSNKPIRMNELAELICEVFHSKSEIITEITSMKSGRNEAIHTRIPDISTLKSICANSSFLTEFEQSNWKTYLFDWLSEEFAQKMN